MELSTAAGYHTATLAKGLDVLEALAEVEEAGLSELARRLGLSAPTLFRILATLAARGYVQKTPASRYRLTLRTWEVGARSLRRLSIRTAALPHMARLALATGESPLLALRQGDEVVIVEKAESPQPVRVETYVGQRAPLHCSAMGKVLVAFGAPEAEAALLAGPLERFQANTLDDPAALATELDAVRRQGFALNRGEWRPGVSAVAVPLPGPDGRAAAALSLTLPTERFSEAALQERLLPALRRAADAIALDTGARPPGGSLPG